MKKRDLIRVQRKLVRWLFVVAMAGQMAFVVHRLSALEAHDASRLGIVEAALLKPHTSERYMAGSTSLQTSSSSAPRNEPSSTLSAAAPKNSTTARNLPIPDTCIGKEPLLQRWRDMTPPEPAGDRLTMERDAEACDYFPTWKQITDQYGDAPVVLGLETCQTYRQLLAGRTPMIGVAGMYNTGTNSFMTTLHKNIRSADGEPIDLEVPWGKHMAARYRNRTREATEVVNFMLPIVMIRDPYRWLVSMVRLD